jgi:ABC-type nitrate/sulfonate/bicarbonate transport system permease component
MASETSEPSATGLRVRSLVSVLIIIALWEVAARLQLAPPLFLPAFSTVMVQLWASILDGTLFKDLSTSLMRAFSGLALATIAGVLLGVSMARSRFMHWLFDPIVALGFPSPKIAFLPVFIVWFGIYSLSKILLVAFACVFPIIIGSYAAARGINRVLIWSGHSMGASGAVMLARVVLPACGPRVFSAMRVALPVALITTFTAEMVAGGGGMGATLMYSQRFFESPVVFAYIVVMLAVGIILDAGMVRLQRLIPAARND